MTDTHCIRLCNRIGLVHDCKDPKKVEMALWKIVPPEEGSSLCHRFVEHGREVCTARTTPHCERCVLADICEKNGVENSIFLCVSMRKRLLHTGQIFLILSRLQKPFCFYFLYDRKKSVSAFSVFPSTCTSSSPSSAITASVICSWNFA